MPKRKATEDGDPLPPVRKRARQHPDDPRLTELQTHHKELYKVLKTQLVWERSKIKKKQSEDAAKDSRSFNAELQLARTLDIARYAAEKILKIFSSSWAKTKNISEADKPNVTVDSILASLVQQGYQPPTSRAIFSHPNPQVVVNNLTSRLVAAPKPKALLDQIGPRIRQLGVIKLKRDQPSERENGRPRWPVVADVLSDSDNDDDRSGAFSDEETPWDESGVASRLSDDDMDEDNSEDITQYDGSSGSSVEFGEDGDDDDENDESDTDDRIATASDTEASSESDDDGGYEVPESPTRGNLDLVSAKLQRLVEKQLGRSRANKHGVVLLPRSQHKVIFSSSPSASSGQPSEPPPPTHQVSSKVGLQVDSQSNDYDDDSQPDDSEDDEELSSPDVPKPAFQNGPPLPTLLNGYTSSTSDDETSTNNSDAPPSHSSKRASTRSTGEQSKRKDLHSPEPKRKNRRGQRERQAIAELKYKRNANHLKKRSANEAATRSGAVYGTESERRAGWDPRKGAIEGGGKQWRGGRAGGAAENGAKQGQGMNRTMRRLALKGNKNRATGANGDRLGGPSRLSERKLAGGRAKEGGSHPSWEAARNRKEREAAGTGTGGKTLGKKIVFE